MESSQDKKEDKILIFLNLSHWEPPEQSLLSSIFNKFLDWLKDKIVEAKEFVGEKITASVIGAKKAIFEEVELRDKDTGEIYCIEVKSGELTSAKGECGTATSTEPRQ